MGFTLKVEGPSTIDLGTVSITGVKFRTDIPLDSNARSTDLGSTVEISGKILTAVDGDPFDSTRQLGIWSLVPAEKSDCYRKVTVEVIAASQVVRKYTYPNAFVVDYKEDYGDTEGVGTFRLIIKQKKDKMAQIAVEGGYSV
ncbi:membrane-associated protease 1 [Lachnospiraceae bacterium 54-53]